MKGIVLAGGAGKRLYPLTEVASKQLQAVYDKPMIYYPLSTLMSANIRDILLITTPEDVSRFERLLGDGSQWGIDIAYAVQPEPKGIAQAFVIAESFVGAEPVTLILGDNIFYGQIGLEQVVRDFTTGAYVFGYPVADPERYGVVEFAADGTVVSIEEKPTVPKSRYAVPGLYVYDSRVVEMVKAMVPSPRGELEITDVNRAYLASNDLHVQLFDRGVAWLDSGTHDSLLEAANYIATIERRQGVKIACLEEIAMEKGFVGIDDVGRAVAQMPHSGYRSYLEALLNNQ